jgi:hypothetical protein
MLKQLQNQLSVKQTNLWDNNKWIPVMTLTYSSIRGRNPLGSLGLYTPQHMELLLSWVICCAWKLKDEEWARECTSVYAGVGVQFHKGQEKMDCCPTHHWFEPIKGFSFLVDNFWFSSSLKYCKIEDILPNIKKKELLIHHFKRYYRS